MHASECLFFTYFADLDPWLNNPTSRLVATLSKLLATTNCIYSILPPCY